jgi:DnaJ-class molecular chaperone
MNATKNHPDDVVCTSCNGSGYASAARDMGMEDMPMMLKPIGVYLCPSCNGSGLMIDGEKMSKWVEYLEDNKELIEESMAALRTKRKD